MNFSSCFLTEWSPFSCWARCAAFSGETGHEGVSAGPHTHGRTLGLGGVKMTEQTASCAPALTLIRDEECLSGSYTVYC